MLNAKLTKTKNADFRLKLDAWKNRKAIRKTYKKQKFEHGKAIRSELEKSKSLFNVDKEKLLACIDEFNIFDEEFDQSTKDAKTLNDFLACLPEGSLQILEQGDLDRLFKNEQTKFNAKLQLLQDFVTIVKQECVINSSYFIFFDIPELIVKKKYSRKDYEDIIKIVDKVKTRYLAEKAKQMPDKPLAVVS